MVGAGIDGEIDLNEHTLGAFRNGKPRLTANGNNFDYLQILDRLDAFGLPMLRWRLFEGSSDRGGRKIYCAASIGRDLGMEWEYADSGRSDQNSDQNSDTKIGIYESWIIGFLAKALYSLKSVITIHNAFMQGVLRVEIFVSGEHRTIAGNHVWPETGRLPEGRIKIPDFEIFQMSDLNIIFEQLQDDLYAIAGIENYTKIKCEDLQ